MSNKKFIKFIESIGFVLNPNKIKDTYDYLNDSIYMKSTYYNFYYDRSKLKPLVRYDDFDFLKKRYFKELRSYKIKKILEKKYE